MKTFHITFRGTPWIIRRRDKTHRIPSEFTATSEGRTLTEAALRLGMTRRDVLSYREISPIAT